MIQQDLFGDNATIQQNPLTDRRVGFIGKFKNRAALVKKVKEFGASEKSKEGLTRDTQILVMGNDVKQEDLNRLKCYEHDGWKPLKGVRCSSPLVYGDDNPIYGMEIYVPNRPNTDMSIIRKLLVIWWLCKC